MTYNSRMSKEPILVIGIGNPECGDDAVGLVVARKLDELKLPHVQVVESQGEISELVEFFRTAETIFAVDALQSDAPAGTLFRFGLDDIHEFKGFSRHSTHSFGLPEAIELVHSLNQLPRDLVIFGVAGCDFTVGSSVSGAVQAAISEIVDRIRDEIEVRTRSHRKFGEPSPGT